MALRSARTDVQDERALDPKLEDLGALAEGLTVDGAGTKGDDGLGAEDTLFERNSGWSLGVKHCSR